MRRLLLLWDVDGTLIDNGNYSLGMYRRLAERVLGRPVDSSVDPIHGRTDPINCYNILRDAKVDPDLIAQNVEEMLQLLPEDLRTTIDRAEYAGRVLPGAAETLRACAERGAVNALLTGNLSLTAEMKMNALGLSEYLELSIGGYADDAATRNELLAISVEKAERQLSHRFDAEHIWVIGDTPHDYEVAHVAGVRSMLVATGIYSYEELADLGPDVLIQSLQDTGRVMHGLFGGDTERSKMAADIQL